MRQGQRFLRAELPRILATPPDVLSPRMVHVIEELAGDWHRLDEHIEALSGENETFERHRIDPARASTSGESPGGLLPFGFTPPRSPLQTRSGSWHAALDF